MLKIILKSLKRVLAIGTKLNGGTSRNTFDDESTIWKNLCFDRFGHLLIRFGQWVQGLHLITGLVKYGVTTTTLIRNIEIGSMGKRRQRQESRQSSKQSASGKKTSKKAQNRRKSKQKCETTWIKSETSTKEPDKCSLSKLQQAMRKRLDGSRFRMLNEELYTKTGDAAFQTFQNDPELFDIVCT